VSLGNLSAVPNCLAMASKEDMQTDQPVSVEVEENETLTHVGNEVDSKKAVDDARRRAGAKGGGVEGGASPSVSKQPIIVSSGNAILLKCLIRVTSV